MKKPAKKLTKKRQLAVDIAKDVLKWIGLKKILLTSGGYFYGALPTKECKISPEDQVQKHLPLLRQYCSVCAKGAIFLSYVELKNNVVFGSHIHSSGANSNVHFMGEEIVQLLGSAFSKVNLDLIEAAYEKWPHYCYKSVTGKKGKARFDQAFAFGEKYKTNHTRMIAICENIIKNDGEFKP